MPAVNPERLRQQVEDLLTLLGDQVALKRQCLDLLDYYADHTRRSLASGGIKDAERVFGAPRPVVRALSQGLRSRTQQKPALILPTATVLWEAGYRETRLLASAIVGGIQQMEVAQWVEARASNCDDSVVLMELASQGLAGLREADPTGFLERASEWLKSTHRWLRLFALMALHAAVENPTFEDLPTVFRLLSGVSEKARGESRQVLYALLRTLTKRSPPESARFLLDELAREIPGTQRMIRTSLGHFPARQQELLKRALSVKKRTGIIPPS
jgi:hypothetical protein